MDPYKNCSITKFRSPSNLCRPAHGTITECQYLKISIKPPAPRCPSTVQRTTSKQWNCISVDQHWACEARLIQKFQLEKQLTNYCCNNWGKCLLSDCLSLLLPWAWRAQHYLLVTEDLSPTIHSSMAACCRAGCLVSLVSVNNSYHCLWIPVPYSIFSYIEHVSHFEINSGTWW